MTLDKLRARLGNQFTPTIPRIMFVGGLNQPPVRYYGSADVPIPPPLLVRYLGAKGKLLCAAR